MTVSAVVRKRETGLGISVDYGAYLEGAGEFEGSEVHRDQSGKEFTTEDTESTELFWGSTQRPLRS